MRHCSLQMQIYIFIDINSGYDFNTGLVQTISQSSNATKRSTATIDNLLFI